MVSKFSQITYAKMNFMFKFSIWQGFLLAGCLLMTFSSSAQTSAKASIRDLNTATFPILSFYLDVHNGEGAFIHGLQASDIKIIEDDQPIPALDFSELRPGVMLTVVLNPGASFTIRNSQGYSRYDSVLEALVNWSRIRLGSTIDDLSITVTNGPERTHISNPFELFYTLSNYQVDAQTAQPGLDSLFRAVEITSDPVPRIGMERNILFITSPMEGDLSFNIQNLLSQAHQKNIHIFIWIITPQSTSDEKSADNLSELANQTGGTVFTFTGNESIPNLETYLEPQRSLYWVSYQSKLKSGGKHQILAEINPGALTVQTEPVEFEINLQPPNPVFIAPKLKIERKLAQKENQIFSNKPAELLPNSHKLQILVDFPDGRARNITHSALYVDGRLAVENQEAPFDQFIWDLSRYNQSGQHLLQVEVTDSLGLTGKTIETPVIITVDQPSTFYLANLKPYLPIIVAMVVIIGGAIGLLALILGGKIQPKSPFRTRSRMGSEKSQRAIGQSASIKNDHETTSKPTTGWTQRRLGSERQAVPLANAYLTRISEEETTATVFPIVTDELIIGSDPNQALLVLDDPSIEAFHARLVRLPDSSYRIIDEASIAGTWVNFVPISKAGVILNHADLIYFGKIGFRFTLREPPQLTKPVIVFEGSK